MRYKIENVKHERVLTVGDICYLRQGEEQLALPIGGPARILVIEKERSACGFWGVRLRL